MFYMIFCALRDYISILYKCNNIYWFAVVAWNIYIFLNLKMKYIVIIVSILVRVMESVKWISIVYDYRSSFWTVRILS